MVRKGPTTAVSILVLLTLTGYSCSLPFFNKNADPTGAIVSEKAGSGLPAKLSGVIDLGEGCKPGYYQVHLTGLFEGGSNQVESQSDQAGHFSLVAAPGRYLIQVTKDGCGSKQTILLEDNTEHMISIQVTETKGVERFELPEGRLPASVLIPAHR